MEGSVLVKKKGEEIESVLDKKNNRVIGRLSKGDDLFSGIIEVCKKHNIYSGSFQCIGSLSSVGYVQLKKGGTKGLKYSEPIYIDNPVEILGGVGFIGFDKEDELEIHYHGTFVDSEGFISGGHFLKGMNPTAVTVEYMIHGVENVEMKRQQEPIWDLPVFRFSERR